jgi:hypothetical protein
MMKNTMAVLALLCCAVFTGTTFAETHLFDDFSSLTTDPELSGDLTSSYFTVTFSGDDGSILSDSDNGSFNSLALGDGDPFDRTASLTILFNIPIMELTLEFDAMHEFQNDCVTASVGTWTAFPDSLSLFDQTLTSTFDIFSSPGGSGLDDDLITILSFAAPTSSITLTNVGGFALDALEVTVTPEPATIALLTLGGLALRRRKKA